VSTQSEIVKIVNIDIVQWHCF